MTTVMKRANQLDATDIGATFCWRGRRYRIDAIYPSPDNRRIVGHRIDGPGGRLDAYYRDNQTIELTR